MKRELWMAASAFSNGVLILNSLFCENKEKTDGEINNAELDEVIKFIKDKCSPMMIEDALEVLEKALKLKEEEKAKSS